jgi:integrase
MKERRLNMAKRRGNGEGSIWKEGKSWRVGVTLDGRRLTKSFSTQSECQSWLQDMKNQVNQGLTYRATQLTLEVYLKKWLLIHKSSLAPRIGERYEQVARDYILPFIGKYKLKDIRIEKIENLYQDLLKEGKSVRTVHWVHSILHKCLKDALKRGLVGFNAAHGARKPKLNQKEMEFLNESEVLQFLMFAHGTRNEGLYHVAIKTGMRQGELLGLKWSDLDWNKRIIRVQRQVQRIKGQGIVFMRPKTKAALRSIRLGEATIQTLRRHMAQQQLEKAFAGERWENFDLIFPSRVGTPQSQSNLLKEFKVLLKEAGVKKIRFHDLRHTAASLMLNHGIAILIVSKMLGHSKPSTTLDIYGHLIPTMQEGVASLMDELVTPIPVKMGETVDLEAVSV